LEANNGGNLDETQFFDTVSQQGEDDGQVLVNFFDKGEDQLDEEGVDGQQLGDDEVNN
jgi:hypothetical protein